jgi:Rrf2 family protein
VRISAKSDYAVRAMAELAVAYGANGPALKAEQIADAQEIPLNFLLGILRELRNAHLVRSVRGRDGGYRLSRPPAEIALADVIRAVDGPLANVRDLSLSQLSYPGAAESLREVWMAVRGSLREVLENVSVADLATGKLPKNVRALAAKHQTERM